MKCDYCTGNVVIIDEYNKYYTVECTNKKCGVSYNIKKDDYNAKNMY